MLSRLLVAGMLAVSLGGCFNAQLNFTQREDGLDGEGGGNGGGCAAGRNCFVPGIVPSAAFKGSFDSTGIQTNLTPVNPLSLAPGAAAGASELLSGATLGQAEITTLTQPLQMNDGFPPAPTETDGAYASVTGTFQQPVRAVLQVQWEASQLDLDHNAYASVQFMFHGGSEGSGCSGSRNPVMQQYVAGGVFDQLKGYWIPISKSQDPGQWSFGGGMIPIKLSDALVAKADGKSYLVLNFESTYASEAQNCASSVHVAGVSLQLVGMDPPSEGNCANCTVNLGALAPGGYDNLSQTGYFKVATSQSVPLMVGGGTPPYTFAVTSGSGTIDSETGRFYALGVTETDTVHVTDSLGKTATTQLRVLDAQAALALAVSSTSGSNSDGTGSYVAGDCYDLIVQPIGFNNDFPTQNGVLDFDISGSSGQFFMSEADCEADISPITQPYINSGSNYSHFYFQLGRAGTNLEMNAMDHDGSGIASNVIDYSVTPGAPFGFDLVGADPDPFGNPVPPFNVTNKGSCTPFRACLEDSYGNITGNSTANTYAAYGSENAGNGAGFFVDSDCLTPTGNMSPAVAPGDSCVNLYFFDPGSDSATTSDHLTAGCFSSDVSGFSCDGMSQNGVQVTVADPAKVTRLHLKVSSGVPGPGACVGVVLSATDMDGTPAGSVAAGGTVVDTVNSRQINIGLGWLGGGGGEAFDSLDCQGTQLQPQILPNLGASPYEFSVHLSNDPHGKMLVGAADATSTGGGTPPYDLNPADLTLSW